MVDPLGLIGVDFLGAEPSKYQPFGPIAAGEYIGPGREKEARLAIEHGLQEAMRLEIKAGMDAYNATVGETKESAGAAAASTNTLSSDGSETTAATDGGTDGGLETDPSPDPQSNGDSDSKLPEGVLNVKDVEEAEKNGTPRPGVYFVNESSEMAYVLREDAEYPTAIAPGQLYTYPIEGAATTTTGVYKIKDYGSLYADKDGRINPNGIIGNTWKFISGDVGPKDYNWIKKREAAQDFKWVRLYNSIR